MEENKENTKSLDKVFVEVDFEGKTVSDGTRIFTTVNSFLAIYVHKYLGSPKNVEINYVRTNLKLSQARIELDATAVALNLIHSKETIDCQPIRDLKLPVFVKDETTFISGMCAVCREIVSRGENGNRRDLLGFKGSCLLAPSESSTYTRFCELDVVRDLENVLLTDFGAVEEYTLPGILSRFEGHMNEPVRMHNIYKQARAQANEGLSKSSKNRVRIECTTPKESLDIHHRFAEGINFSIADLLLYACFRLTFDQLPVGADLPKNFPLTAKWLDEVVKYDEDCSSVYKTLLSALPQRKTLNLSYRIDDYPKTSLYKSYKPRNRVFTEQTEIDSSIEKLAALSLDFTSDNAMVYDQHFDWDEIGPGHIENSELPEVRLKRKKQQLENLANAVIALAKDNDRIIDFCSGTGHLGILLALKLPRCTVIILENKAISIERAKKRSEDLKLTNCLFYQCNLDYFEGIFDIGTSLHACGTATDIVLSKCLQSRAKFVCCPCCYGSIRPMPHISYPLSKKFRAVMEEKDFLHIAHAADQAHALGTMNCKPEITMQGLQCMDIVDSDRKLSAEEAGYTVILTRLKPEDCTPKNRLLVGVC